MRPFLLSRCLILAAASLCAAPAAMAQQAGRFQGGSIEDGAKKLQVGAPKQNLSDFGHQIAPGVVFMPTATLETGYDTNPDGFFTGAEGSPYGLANMTGVFGFLRENGATTLTLRGTFLQYNEDIDDSGRWDAGLAIDNAYAVATGLVATFGAYYLRDQIPLVPSDNGGGYGQLNYKDPEFEAFGRVKLDQIGYLGAFEGSPSTDPLDLLLFQPSQFDVRRAEATSGFIFGPQMRVGFYSEVGGANLDYYSQGVEDLLDRDATEIWAKAGFRFNLHPSLVIDAGWRANARQLDDRRVDDPSSNFFDGRVVWTPMQTLQFSAEVNRSFVEPVSPIALVGDRVHFGGAVAYKARPDLELAAALRHDRIEQIGDVFDYHETGVSVSLTYLWSEAAVVYGLIGNEHVEEQSTGLSYDKLRVGAGTRIRF